jgi:hypothetical protein
VLNTHHILCLTLLAVKSFRFVALGLQGRACASVFIVSKARIFESMEDHVRNHTARNSKSSAEAVHEVIQIIGTHAK